MKGRQPKQFHHYVPALAAFAFFIVTLSIAFYYTTYRRAEWEKEIRSELRQILTNKKSKLEKSLSSRIYFSKAMAAFLSVHPDMCDYHFNAMARQIIGTDTVIRSLSLAPDGIIQSIYPAEKHKPALGLNLLEHPQFKKAVEQAIVSGKTILAGPLEMPEGGTTFISYTPIFTETTDGKKTFWGMTDVVLRKDELLADAGLHPSENKLLFALKGENGSGDAGHTFWGDQSVFNDSPVTVEINLPFGNWILGVTPENGWISAIHTNEPLLLILFIACLSLSLMFFAVLKSQLKVRSSQREFRAIFRSMQNLILEFTDEGEYVSIPETNKDLLYRDESELIGKKVTDIFEPRMAGFFMKAIKECIEKKGLVEIEYPLDINGKTTWFSSRISYKSPKRVILNAYDITDRKINEENLKASERHQKEMNAVKDKFFSIIAHDLRNPVGSFKMLTGIMLNELGTADPERTRQMLSSIHLASSNLHDLLENLLNWSHTQRKTLVVNSRIENLYDLVVDAIDSQQAHAEVKDIEIVNRISERGIIYCDPFISLTILRNLLSNAIKFTPEKGRIEVSSEVRMIDEVRYQCVAVTDNGRGISPQRLQVILNSKASDTTPGTASETGTGLGLMLCHEFVDLQKGIFDIQSEVGRGTSVTFGLPFPADVILPF